MVDYTYYINKLYCLPLTVFMSGGQPESWPAQVGTVVPNLRVHLNSRQF